MIVTDNFNRTENPLANGVWSGLGSLTDQCKANGTVILGQTAGVDNASIYSAGPLFLADGQFAEIVSATVDAGGSKGVLVLASSSSAQGYLLAVGVGASGIYKYNGTFTIMGASFVNVDTAGHTYRLTAKLNTDGSVTLTFFDNGSSVGTRTDSTSPYLTGFPGVYFFNNGGTSDSFQAGDGPSQYMPSVGELAATSMIGRRYV